MNDRKSIVPCHEPFRLDISKTDADVLLAALDMFRHVNELRKLDNPGQKKYIEEGEAIHKISTGIRSHFKIH